MSRSMKLTAYDEFGVELNGIHIQANETEWDSMSEEKRDELKKDALMKLFRVRVSPVLDAGKITEYGMKEFIFDYCRGEGVQLNEGIQQIIELLKMQIR